MKASSLPSELERLLAQRNYGGYVETHDARQEEIHPADHDLYQFDLFHVLLALRAYDRARRVAIAYHESAANSPKFARNLGRGLLEIGAAEWMLGNEDDALARWSTFCKGVRSGRFKHVTDAAGGVYAGLLLWFGAVGTKKESALAEARSYLENRTHRVEDLKNTEIWPTHAAYAVLGQRDFESLVDDASRMPSFVSDAEPSPHAMENLHRDTCLAYFVIATYEQSRSGRSAALERFAQAAAIDAPITELSWHLARFECERAR